MHSDHMSTFVSQNFGQGQVHGQRVFIFLSLSLITVKNNGYCVSYCVAVCRRSHKNLYAPYIGAYRYAPILYIGVCLTLEKHPAPCVNHAEFDL